ncbi:hypothetical protein GQX74_000139 [Glossina fuscipes]|nr:hypothetical protein GQX74_000139 [Glossina fuscipes]
MDDYSVENFIAKCDYENQKLKAMKIKKHDIEDVKFSLIMTMKIQSVDEGHVTIAKLLVDSKATIDLQDDDGETAFIGPLRELPELIGLDIATAVAKILSSLDIFSSSTKPNSDGFIMNPFVVAHLKKLILQVFGFEDNFAEATPPCFN